MSDPERLIHRSGIVGALLESARDDGPSPEARARAAQALGVAAVAAVHVAATSAAPLASSPSGAGTVGAHAASAGAGAATIGAAGGAGVGTGTVAVGVAKSSFLATMTGKLVVALAATGIVTSAAVARRPRAEAPPSSSSATPAAPVAPHAHPASPSPAAPRSPERSSDEERASDPPVTRASAEPRAAHDGAPLTTQGPAAAGSSLASEVRAIELARAALASGDAARALERASDYRAAHPAGALTQEARMIELEAHAALGHTIEVARLGEAMLRAEPNGPQSRRVRTLLEGRRLERR